MLALKCLVLLIFEVFRF